MEPTEQNNDQPNQSSPQVIKPEDMFKPSISVGPPSTPSQPAPQNNSDMPPINSDPGLKKRIFIVVGGLVALFIVALVVIVLLNSKNKNNQSSQNTQSNQTNGILNPPSALDIQNANNSITADISSLNDDTDFPTNNLTDNNLHL